MTVIDNNNSPHPESYIVSLAFFGMHRNASKIPHRNLQYRNTPYGELQAIQLPGAVSISPHAQVVAP
jgi:hypothetical protein